MTRQPYLFDAFIYVKGRKAIPFIRIGDIIVCVCLIVLLWGYGGIQFLLCL